MKATLLLLALVGLTWASLVHAAERSLAAEFSWPLPAYEIGKRPAGFDVVLSFDHTERPRLGVGIGLGVDVGYHYWPTSEAYFAGYDAYLNRTQGQRIDATHWEVSVYQLTPHLRIVLPLSERVVPWVRLGGGLYYFDRNLADPDWTGSTTLYRNTREINSSLPGFTTSLGFDIRVSPRTLVGLAANYHHVASDTDHVPSTPIPKFRALTLGTQFRFGW